MKNDGWYWMAGAAIGLALSVGSCRQKEAAETPKSSVTLAPNPAPEKSGADDPSTAANTGSDAGVSKAPQGQKSDDAKKSSKG